MKTMNNFAAQQLTKKQMNEVLGGTKFKCTVTYADGTTTKVKIKADDTQMLVDMMLAATPDGGRMSC